MTPFFDGAGQQTEIRVFYNGILPATPQVTGSISATVIAVIRGRAPRTLRGSGAHRERRAAAARRRHRRGRPGPPATAARGRALAGDLPAGSRHAGLRSQAREGRSMNPTPPLRRRRCRARGAGRAGVRARWRGAQPEATPAAEPPRLALLIGNREYPDGDDLPPIHKNVRDLRRGAREARLQGQRRLDARPAAASAALAGVRRRRCARRRPTRRCSSTSPATGRRSTPRTCSCRRASTRSVRHRREPGARQPDAGQRVIGQLPHRPRA